MQLNKTMLASALGLAISLSSCGTPGSISSSRSAIPDTTTASQLMPPNTLVEPNPTEATERSPDAVGEPTLDAKSLDRLSQGPRVRALLPTIAPIYPQDVTIGGGRTSDGTWMYGLAWLWSNGPISKTPDGRPINSDWGLAVIGPPPGQVHELPKTAIPLWTSGKLTFSMTPSQPCQDRSTVVDWSALEMSIRVSDGGRIIADVDLIPSVADCGYPGENVTPTELVDFLISLVDCEIGGDTPVMCSPTSPPSDAERKAAIEILTNSGRVNTVVPTG